MSTITLYHGSAKKIEKFEDYGVSGLYFAPSIELAAEYIANQADNAIGDYGFIYKVEVSISNVVTTEDIDQLIKCDTVLHSEDENYYRIDCPSKYAIAEMSNNEIGELL